MKRLGEQVIPSEVSLKINVVEDLWECRGEMAEISEVFQQAMQNASEAMPEGGALEVKVGNRLFDANFENLAPEAKAGAYISFVFTDNGHGIEERLIKRVAEPFFTTKSPGEGTGLGLAIVKRILRDHRGDIVVESTAPGGTTFKFWVPAVK